MSLEPREFLIEAKLRELGYIREGETRVYVEEARCSGKTLRLHVTDEMLS